MFIKVLYNSQCHVYNSKSDSSFKALLKYIGEVFKKIPSKFYLTYFDDEDEITLACESDFETMSQLFDKKPAKIFIKQVDESYYDQTQKVVLDDEAVEQIQQKMEELNINEIEDQVLISKSEAPKTSEIDLDLTGQINPIEEEKSVSDCQPEIIEEKTLQTEEYNSVFDQSEAEISQISQITEAEIEEKFREMIPEFMEKVKDSLLRKSTVQSQSSQKAKIVHNHVTCDECGQRNIEGVRYKCAVCADFDLCQKCEATSTHDHPFLKVKHPRQTPFKIIAIVRDEEQNSFEVNGNRVHLPESPFVNQLFDAFCQRPPRPEGYHGMFGHHGFGPRGPHGFGHGRRSGKGCPFKNQGKMNEQMKEEKVEQKCEPEKKVKVEEQKPVEKKVEQKVEPKIEPKRIPFEAKEDDSEKIRINARYLFESLNGFVQINEGDCYDFANKNPKVTKEDLLDLYFSSRP